MTADQRTDSIWPSEEQWLSARRQVIDELTMWQETPWIYFRNRMHIGIGKLRQVYLLKRRLARIEAAGAPAWRQRLRARSE
jgi:hypothetical protein